VAASDWRIKRGFFQPVKKSSEPSLHISPTIHDPHKAILLSVSTQRIVQYPESRTHSFSAERQVSLKEVKMQALMGIFTGGMMIGFLFVSLSAISWLCE